MKANLDFQFYKSQKVDYNKGVHKNYAQVDSETLKKILLNVIKSQLWKLLVKIFSTAWEIDENASSSLFMLKSLIMFGTINIYILRYGRGSRCY